MTGKDKLSKIDPPAIKVRLPFGAGVVHFVGIGGIGMSGIAEVMVNLGYTVGAGTDVKITEQVFARGEYRYTDYGTEAFRTGSGVNKVSASENRVSLGLGVKF